MQLKRIIVIFLLLSALAPMYVNATVIFQDNFDSTTWNPTAGTECGGSYWPCGTSGSTFVPNWDGYRALPTGTSSHHGYIGAMPSSLGDHTTGTTSGHAFVSWYGGTADTSDNPIAKRLSTTTSWPEVWVVFYLKSSGQVSVAGGASQKIFRVTWLDADYDNMMAMFRDGSNGPGWFVGLDGSSTGTGTWKTSVRCGPQQTNYYCNTDYDSLDARPWNPSGLGWKDGNWHKIKVRLKINTSLGASDGIAQWWVDGVQFASQTNIQFRGSGDNAQGWNQLEIGGNTPSGTSPDSWIAFDDLIVATTEAEADGGGDTTAPTVTITTANRTTIKTNSLTVTGTDSDDTAVTSCKWRIGAAPDDSNGTACENTDFSCATSGYTRGLNTLYVGCTDAAGNWGSSSILVDFSKLTHFH